ncbi:sulfate transporter [Halorubraceae archaeon YAN]|nr:sulfate transporter [Halorubraceae archaeon YAN]
MAFGHSTGRSRISLTRSEVTGAVGDSLTVLPIVVALALVTDISLAHVLIAFGIFQIVWGVVYGLPISVEPMKALAALAIAGAITYAELALAGIILGVVLLTIGLTDTLSIIEQWIGEPVIRGIQFAVGLLLFETGVGLGLSDPLIGLFTVGLVGAVIVVGYKNLSAIVVLAVGVAIAVYTVGVPTPQWPGVPQLPPISEALTRATVDGITAQLAMTIGNAALATSLLFSDLFDREVSPDDLSTSMGVMNLTAVPIGGIPMCHGCDGVAGKYEFGARTGGANLILGVSYIALAFIATMTLLSAFPLSVLGVLLIVVAISLGKHVLRSQMRWLSIGIGLLALVVNLGVAFLVGIAVHLLLTRGAKTHTAAP